jgi:hypothetical protein
MTANGLGNTALTICASWLTVVRISLNNASIPGSLVGAGASGSPIVFQLEPDVSTSSDRPEMSTWPLSPLSWDASSRTLSLEMKKSCWLTYI